MNVIKELKKRLSKYKGFVIEETENQLVVTPKASDSFKVSLLVDDNKYQVSYEVFSNHYLEANDAIKSFMFGLSGDVCRLKCVLIGGKPIRWTLEEKDRTQWISRDNDIRKYFYPFWKAKTVRYLSNNIVV